MPATDKPNIYCFSASFRGTSLGTSFLSINILSVRKTLLMTRLSWKLFWFLESRRLGWLPMFWSTWVKGSGCSRLQIQRRLLRRGHLSHASPQKFMSLNPTSSFLGSNKHRLACCSKNRGKRWTHTGTTGLRSGHLCYSNRMSSTCHNSVPGQNPSS